MTDSRQGLLSLAFQFDSGQGDVYTYSGKIVHVVDGDTVDVELDLGFDVKIKQRVRLVGINAPERFTEAGKKATQFVVDWAARNPDIIVRSIKNDYDKYGRYLADIFGNWIAAETLSEEMLIKGLAKVYP